MNNRIKEQVVIAFDQIGSALGERFDGSLGHRYYSDVIEQFEMFRAVLRNSGECDGDIDVVAALLTVAIEISRHD